MFTVNIASIAYFLSWLKIGNMNLPERLAEAFRLSGKSRTQLAAAIGVSTSAISQWLSGSVKSLKGSTAAKIEAATGVRAAWIVEGTGPKMVGDAPNVTPAALGVRRIPLIDYVQAGNWTCPTDPYVLGDAAEWLMTDLDLAECAFALEIKGDSMLPDFRPGDRVIIDPEVQPQPGDFVVAKNGEGEATFKKYRPRGANERGDVIFELVPLNDDYPSMRSDITPIHIVGTMIEHRKYRRR